MQESSSTYREAVSTLIAEMQEMIAEEDTYVFVGVLKTTRSGGADGKQQFANIARVYTLPEGVEPILPTEDEV